MDADEAEGAEEKWAEAEAPAADADEARARDARYSLSQSLSRPAPDSARMHAARWMAPLLFLAPACADARFGRFEASLTAEQRERLAALA